MQPYQTRARRMRKPGHKVGRSTDGTCRSYHSPDPRSSQAAFEAARAAAADAARPENQIEENQP